MMQKSKPESVKNKKRKALFGWTIAAFILFAAGLLMLAISYTPRAYNPLRPSDPELVSPYLTHKLGPDFYNQVQFNRPFDLIVDQAGFNDILSRYPWPMNVDGISFSMPTVIFTVQSVTLMTQIDIKGLSSVLSIYALPVFSDDGKINLNIQTVSLGAVPITPIAEAIANKFALESFGANPDKTDLSASLVQAILSNQPFEPVFTIADHTVRVTELELQPNQLRLKLEPIRE